MRYPTTKSLIVTLAVVVVGIIAGWFFFYRTPAILSKEQQKFSYLDRWNSCKTVAISSNELRFHISTIIKKTPVTSYPPRAIPAQPNALNDSTTHDLVRALELMLQGYGSESADGIIRFMSDRDEVPNPDCLESARKQIIAKSGAYNVRLDQEPISNVLRQYHQLCCPKSVWDSIAVDEGGLLLWKTTKVPGKEMCGDYFARQKENYAFGNSVAFTHYFFKPRMRTLSDALKAEGNVLFADIHLVIKYSSSLFKEPRPHYFRFWYDHASKKWHPINIFLICTVSQDYPNLLF